MKKCLFSIIILYSIFLFSSAFPQSFKTTPFITIPGNNYDVDVLYNSTYHNIISFISWVNQKDSVYILYLRQTSPDSGKNIVVFADTAQIANPSMNFIWNSDNNNVRIAWQSFVNNHWQILLREFSNDSLTKVMTVTDSLQNNTNPELNQYAIVWIQNGYLLYKYIDLTIESTHLFDSDSCSNPKIHKYVNDYPTIDIVYEKGRTGNKEIIEGYYSCCSRSDSIWRFEKISSGGDNIRPRFGTEYGPISYQELVNGVWKAIYGGVATKNISCNNENPMSFSYPILTKKSNITTPSFVVYDSDSLKNNKEIMMKTLSYEDTTLNISNSVGDDYLPNISFIYYKDSTYLTIFWTHDQNGKKDIWVASTVYNPNYGAVNDPTIVANSFALNQNYPNPFNPSTTISWQLAKNSLVTLKIYDVLGNEITTLVNEYQNAGKHSITFDTQQALKHNLSSGIYFYQLKAGNNITAKKMMYLK